VRGQDDDAGGGAQRTCYRTLPRCVRPPSSHAHALMPWLRVQYATAAPTLAQLTRNKKLVDWVAQRAAQLKPANIHIVNGSAEARTHPDTKRTGG
jgi:hypothetical protein